MMDLLEQSKTIDHQHFKRLIFDLFVLFDSLKIETTITITQPDFDNLVFFLEHHLAVNINHCFCCSERINTDLKPIIRDALKKSLSDINWSIKK